MLDMRTARGFERLVNFSDAVIAIAADPEGSRRFGANGRRYRSTVLDEESAIDQFTELLTRLIADDDRIATGVSPR